MQRIILFLFVYFYIYYIYYNYLILNTLQYSSIYIVNFISDLIYREYNYIDKFDFLDNYQCAQLKIFQQSVIIQNSFAASGLVPIDAEGVFSKLNISMNIYTTKQPAKQHI